eukprot:CAMPEP_0204540704 /NCGR_PEP_ID=MMETSP0661-20131031/17686_1 /ASSEMBLY_ACC=CAM_ASM_000606 /TAXON_ID=109239 /ORGANISM="Alexandrium margalefi, Strain AMGDE01CS-322" /LENGTH=38 /DNA_ID= /DNA_START= /DNA_END= /DNA_ORIENTATION=
MSAAKLPALLSLQASCANVAAIQTRCIMPQARPQQIPP